MGHRHLDARIRRAGVGFLTMAAIGTALVAPLATSSTPAGAARIDGARSLADDVSVQFQRTKDRTTDVHLLAWNDFHGNLEAGAGLNIYGQFAGGAAWLAKAVHDKQALYGDKEISVIAGDNIGASPLVDGLFFGEPSTIVTNLMNADFASVGNHEFDKGSNELLRIQNGGCGADGCAAAPYALAGGGTSNTYPGADFQYLSANVVRNDNGQTLFPAVGTRQITNNSGKQFTIGIIGEVLEATPTIVTPTGVAGLTFQDEADAANRAVDELKRMGAKTSVLVIHQGGFQSGTASLNGCAGNLAGSDIAEIASRLDSSIKVIVSAHTHAEYRCTITVNGVTRLITSASSFGRILTDITLTIDDKSGKLVAASAENSIVRNSSNPRTSSADVPLLDLPKDQRVADVVQQYVTAVAPLANQVVGKVSQDILNTANTLGEIPSGDVIADAQLVATQAADKGGAEVAFMNPGGIRGGALYGFLYTPSGTEAPGEVTYGETFTLQPFGNSLVTKTMTGAQIRDLLEQQFPGCGGQTTKRILQISAGFSYEQDPAGADCASRIGNITLKGATVPDDATTYRVTMNNFLAGGGDGFTVFNQGTNALGGAQDIDALVAYLGSFLPNAVPNPPVNRIVAKPV